MWLQHFLIELGIQFHWSIIILCDNYVGYVLYSLHVCVCGCVRYDDCV
jgi:hypothetical protein